MNATLIRSGLITAVVFAAYSNAFFGVFQFDDFNVIVDELSVHSFSAWLSGPAFGIRPLLKLSYALNWTGDRGIFGFHLFNVAVHAVNAVLVLLLSRSFCNRFPSLRQHSGAIALTTALVFALHPVQTEAVTYISGRSMSLMAMFYFGSMLAYVRGVESKSVFQQHILSSLLFGAAVAVRETAITLPFALLLWESAGQTTSATRIIARSQPVQWAMLGGIIVMLLAHPVYRDLMLFSLDTRSIAANLMNQVHGVFYLLSRFVAVHRLNIDPDLPVAHSWSVMLAAESALLLAALVLGVAALRGRPWIGFGLLWFFLHLLPTNSLLPRLDIANERHLYIAGWGLFLALIVELYRLWETVSLDIRAIKAAVVSALLILGLFTVMRNQVYRSEEALWQKTLETAPDNARAHNNLGFAYFHEGKRKEAIAEYRQALLLRPDYERARMNLQAALAATADDPDASGTEVR